MTIDVELKPFIEGLDKAWPQPPLTMGALAWRARAEELAAQNKLAEYPAGMVVSDYTVTGGKRDVLVRVYKPKEALIGKAACLIYMHGGGWVIGSHETHDAVTAEIAKRTGLVVISVHYARAPENPFPAPLEDCQAVLDWAYTEAESIGINKDKIFTGGDSAGGNLATVLAIKNKDRHIVKGQVLIYPCVDINFGRSSYQTEANAPYMKAEEMIWFWQQYCPDKQQQLDPLVTPIHTKDFTGVAPAIVLVAEHDPLYDEGCEYADVLRGSGVEVDFYPGKGLIHGYLRAINICQAAANDFSSICSWLVRMSQ